MERHVVGQARRTGDLTKAVDSVGKGERAANACWIYGLAQAGRICSPRPAETDTTVSLTVLHAIVGTQCYMAPEQVNGGSAGPPTDLFAVGCILFEMLTGNRAFSGTSLIDVLHAVLHDRPPALSGSPELAIVDRVIRRALEKQPRDRYPRLRPCCRRCANRNSYRDNYPSALYD